MTLLHPRRRIFVSPVPIIGCLCGSNAGRHAVAPTQLVPWYRSSGGTDHRSPAGHQTKNHQKMPIIKLNQSAYECSNEAPMIGSIGCGGSQTRSPHGLRRQAARDAAFIWNRGCQSAQRRCAASALHGIKPSYGSINLQSDPIKPKTVSKTPIFQVERTGTQRKNFTTIAPKPGAKPQGLGKVAQGNASL